MKIRAAIVIAYLLLSGAPAFSQACSMCYSTARATSKDGQKAINRGVFVMLIPTLCFMTGGGWLAVRYSRRRDLEQHR